MRTKFTRERRERILEHLRAGASRQAASRAVGIDRLTFRRWMKRGERVPGGAYGEFRTAVLAAEKAAPRLVPLTEQERWETDPDLAFRWLVKSGEFEYPSFPEPEILRRLLGEELPSVGDG